MDPIEPSSADREQSQRLAARFAVFWAEHRHLVEKLAAIEESTAWAVARRLSQLRRRLAPEGSRRQQCLRFCLHRLRRYLLRQARSVSDGLPQPVANAPGLSADAPLLNNRGPRESALGEGKFRIVFIGSAASCEAQSMRYRTRNVMEALALVGLQGTFVALDEALVSLNVILSHDLIVLVRLMHNPVTARIIESARKLGLPIVYDIDDYLFDPWVLPYVEALRALRRSDALNILNELGACLLECDYFTGSTSYLAERAAAFGKKSFVIHNGLNAAQFHLAQQALERHAARPRDGVTRLGYFSGTRTHQADFRVAYPALMALLRERPDVRLAIVGDLDVGEFPGLAPYVHQIEILPLLHWSELPAAIANVDINLIPLELTPFNEGKSNLKYYEAGLLKVPSIASPTRINRESITHGHNGLLAQTTEEWHAGLKELVADGERRARMGQQAFEYVLRTYAPLATAAEALAAYRQIIDDHRSRRRFSDEDASSPTKESSAAA